MKIMKITGDLTNPKWIYFKALLFLIAGLLSVAALLLENPTARTALLLAIAIWSFCRLYYFMFYVIEKYVDENYRFDGIYAFLLYLLRERHKDNALRNPPPETR